MVSPLDAPAPNTDACLIEKHRTVAVAYRRSRPSLTACTGHHRCRPAVCNPPGHRASAEHPEQTFAAAANRQLAGMSGSGRGVFARFRPNAAPVWVRFLVLM